MKNDLFDQLQKAIQGKPEIPPKDFQTVDQLCAEKGLSRTKALRLLKAGKSAGLIEVRTFRINIGDRIYPVPHYGPKGAER